MRAISSELQVIRQVLMQDRAWLLFVECAIGGGQNFRLVKASRAVQADGKVWQPAAMEITLPGEDVEGSLGELVVTVSNVSRLPITYVEVDGIPLGQEVTVWLQNESRLAAFDPALSWQHVVLAADATEKLMTFSCGHPAQLQRIPSVRFNRRQFRQLLPSGGFR